MKTLFKITFFLLMVTGMGACKKEVLDVLPIDLIPVELAFQNMNDVNNAINGVYGTWSARRSHYISALISDEVRLGTGSEYRNVGNILFNWQHVSDSQDWRDGETGGVWTNLYFVIDRANRVLELMEPVPTETVADADIKKRYRGEMLAIRGMAHLELLRNFAKNPSYIPGETGIVIQRRYIKPNEIANYKPSRSSQAEVIAFIDETLSEARALLPANFNDISRVTRNAVIASQARVGLHTRNWQKVIDSASIVIAALPMNDSAVYSQIWRNKTVPQTGTEVIWKLNITIANLGNAVGSLWQDLNGAVQASPAQKLLNTYNQATDLRYNIFFRTTTTNPPATRNLIAKYGVVLAPNTPPENFEYDIKMIRTSELVLSRAEAYAELDNLPAANADLSALRTKRIRNYVHVPILDKQALIDAIILERYKELCYEAQRYYDLRRRELTISRDLADVANNTLIQNLPPSNSKYIIPIPQQEVFANPNVGQNPGY